jgi:hypothetical protein
MHLFPCAGGVAVAAADPAFGLVRSDGARPLWHESVGADMRGKLQGNFTVSSDGMRVRFGLQEGSQEPVLLEMPAGVLANSQGNPDDLYPPDERGLPISNWLSSEIPKLDGNVLELAPHERSQSVAVTPDKAGFILGSDYNIRRFDKDGSLRCQIPAQGVVGGVNVARQSKLVVAACGDGTLRCIVSRRRAVLSVFIHRADRWIARTPAGFFTTSVGA